MRNPKFQEQYDAILALHPELLDIESDKERAKQIVILGDTVMSTICQEADKIKIHNFGIVAESYKELGIPVPVWLELVHLRRLKRHANLPDKVMEKIIGSYIGAKNVTAFRETAIQSILEDGTNGVVLLESPKELVYEPDCELSNDFLQLLDDSADLRNTLDTVHWPLLRKYGDAFGYLTSEPWSVFKFLLDMHHYRNGGWPSEKTPPRSFSIAKRFNDAFRASERHGFNDVQQWAKRFGLKIELTWPSPTLYQWTESGKRFGQYKIFKIHDDDIDKYANLGIQPYHHLIEAFGIVFAYVWDTREIEAVFDSSEISQAQIHTDFIDNCWDLRLSEKLDDLAKRRAVKCLSELLQDEQGINA